MWSDNGFGRGDTAMADCCVCLTDSLTVGPLAGNRSPSCCHLRTELIRPARSPAALYGESWRCSTQRPQFIATTRIPHSCSLARCTTEHKQTSNGLRCLEHVACCFCVSRLACVCCRVPREPLGGWCMCEFGSRFACCCCCCRCWRCCCCCSLD